MTQPLSRLAAPTLVLNVPDIDTDRIIPARFLTTTESTGLGQFLFADWRESDSGVDAELSRGTAAGAQFLIAGENFGCGSSREHAVWALADHGIRCVIAPSFADIFRANALRNGLVPIRVSEELAAILATDPPQELILDLAACALLGPSGPLATLELAPFEVHCLQRGWDGLDYLLSHQGAIDAYEEARA